MPRPNRVAAFIDFLKMHIAHMELWTFFRCNIDMDLEENWIPMLRTILGLSYDGCLIKYWILFRICFNFFGKDDCL